MKNKILILLSIVLTFSLTGCQNSEKNSSVPKATPISGFCGKENIEESVKYNLTEDGVLTISPNADCTDASGENPMKYFTVSKNYTQVDLELLVSGQYGDVDTPWFDQRDSITKIIIEDGISDITNSAFVGCKNLTDVVIGEGVYKIGGRAFMGCESLKNISLPKSCVHIGPEAFAGCFSLLSIKLPENLRMLNNIFLYCTDLKIVTIPDGIKNIDPNTFLGCVNLSKIEIPASVTSIDDYVFSGCDKLTIHAPKGSYAENFANQHNIKFKALN